MLVKHIQALGSIPNTQKQKQKEALGSWGLAHCSDKALIQLLRDMTELNCLTHSIVLLSYFSI